MAQQFEWKVREVKDGLTGEEHSVIENAGLWTTKSGEGFSGLAPFKVQGKEIRMYIAKHPKAGQKNEAGHNFPAYTVRFFENKSLKTE